LFYLKKQFQPTTNQTNKKSSESSFGLIQNKRTNTGDRVRESMVEKKKEEEEVRCMDMRGKSEF